jgi:hypothetical protein
MATVIANPTQSHLPTLPAVQAGEASLRAVGLRMKAARAFGPHIKASERPYSAFPVELSVSPGMDNNL